jgi:CRP-like cAMP-binding protein
MAVRKHPNSILQRLPSSEFSSIASALRLVELSRGALLFQPDQTPPYIYFPIDSVISFIGDTGEGGSIEVWAVGSEGMAGVSGLLGSAKPFFRGVVQVPGKALQSKTSVLRRHFQKCTPFHDGMLNYYENLLGEVSSLGICNNSHPIEKRFGRWLLMIRDRMGTNELKFTQDAIAAVLGTRRATISVAAAALQAAGLISYTPGMITIRNGKALEKAACRCYNVINARWR